MEEACFGDGSGLVPIDRFLESPFYRARLDSIRTVIDEMGGHGIQDRPIQFGSSLGGIPGTPSSFRVETSRGGGAVCMAHPTAVARPGGVSDSSSILLVNLSRLGISIHRLHRFSQIRKEGSAEAACSSLQSASIGVICG